MKLQLLLFVFLNFISLTLLGYNNDPNLTENINGFMNMMGRINNDGPIGTPVLSCDPNRKEEYQELLDKRFCDNYDIEVESSNTCIKYKNDIKHYYYVCIPKSKRISYMSPKSEESRALRREQLKYFFTVELSYLRRLNPAIMDYKKVWGEFRMKWQARLNEASLKSDKLLQSMIASIPSEYKKASLGHAEVQKRSGIVNFNIIELLKTSLLLDALDTELAMAGLVSKYGSKAPDVIKSRKNILASKYPELKESSKLRKLAAKILGSNRRRIYNDLFLSQFNSSIRNERLNAFISKAMNRANKADLEKLQTEFLSSMKRVQNNLDKQIQKAKKSSKGLFENPILVSSVMNGMNEKDKKETIGALFCKKVYDNIYNAKLTNGVMLVGSGVALCTGVGAMGLTLAGASGVGGLALTGIGTGLGLSTMDLIVAQREYSKARDLFYSKSTSAEFLDTIKSNRDRAIKFAALDILSSITGVGSGLQIGKISRTLKYADYAMDALMAGINIREKNYFGLVMQGAGYAVGAAARRKLDARVKSNLPDLDSYVDKRPRSIIPPDGVPPKSISEEKGRIRTKEFENGSKILEVFDSSSGNTERRVFVDSNGKVIREQSFSNKGELVKTQDFDENGDLRKKVIRDPDNPEKIIFERTYQEGFVRSAVSLSQHRKLGTQGSKAAFFTSDFGKLVETPPKKGHMRVYRVGVPITETTINSRSGNQNARNMADFVSDIKNKRVKAAAEKLKLHMGVKEDEFGISTSTTPVFPLGDDLGARDLRKNGKTFLDVFDVPIEGSKYLDLSEQIQSERLRTVKSGKHLETGTLAGKTLQENEFIFFDPAELIKYRVASIEIPSEKALQKLRKQASSVDQKLKQRRLNFREDGKESSIPIWYRVPEGAPPDFSGKTISDLTQ